MRQKITETDVRDMIMAFADSGEIEALIEEETGQEVTVETECFEDAGLLTMDKGLMLLVQGREFQITVVRSR